MQLQNAKQRFESQGIKLAAISYDSRAILAEFAERLKIDYPLLSDPGSAVIRRFHVLNEKAVGINEGMALPGFFYMDKGGVIREKYFETSYADRFTPNNVIAKLFPELTLEVSQKVNAPHLEMELAQSDRTVIPGNRLSLTVEVQLPPDVHVYAPGVHGYIPVQLKVQSSPAIRLASLSYPAEKMLYLAAIKEQVPVFTGAFRIVQDIKIVASRAMTEWLGATGKLIQVTGELKYQACDQTVCYPPTSVPVSWQLQVLPPDEERSPEAIRHK